MPDPYFIGPPTQAEYDAQQNENSGSWISELADVIPDLYSMIFGGNNNQTQPLVNPPSQAPKTTSVWPWIAGGAGVIILILVIWFVLKKK